VVLTEADKETIEKPAGPYSHYFEAYAASKVHALHATEYFVATNHPSFNVINVMPSFLIGKHELITDPKDITNGTNGAAMGPLLGNKNPYPNPSTTVHINDVAKIEVMALDPKIPGNQNFLVSSGGIEGTYWQDCVEIVKKQFPDAVAKSIFPLRGEQATKSTKVDSSRTEEVFGFKLQSCEDQVVSVAQHYLDILGKA
jgi:nucleoside-diphosphate-sugar epimerase